MTPNETEPQCDRQEATGVCPNCLASVHLRADFCLKCGSPISGISVLDPVKTIHATGWMYRKTSTGRPPLIVVIGAWLIMGPTALLPVFGVCLEMWSSWPHVFTLEGWDLEEVVGILFFAFIWLLHVAILLKVTTAYSIGRWGTPGYCLNCGHNLRGLTEPRCPECGTPLDPQLLARAAGLSTPRTYIRHALQTDGLPALGITASLLWAVAVGKGLLRFAGFDVGHVATAGMLFAFSLSVTLTLFGVSRLWRRQPMTALGLFCTGLNPILAIAMGWRLFSH